MKVEDVARLTPTERFHYWVRERHQIYLRKEVLGRPRPWTDDVILQRYFFTNPYREHDKVTRWFRANVREPLRDDPRVLFAATAFRWFNRPETGEVLMGGEHLSDWHPSWGRTNLLLEWDTRQAINRLCALRNDGGQVFTGAFMCHGRKGVPKHEMVCGYLQVAWEQRHSILQDFFYDSRREPRMQDLHKILMRLPGMGGSGFMTYEVVCDLRHTYLLENATDRSSWSNPGPGAKRGLNRVLGRSVAAPVHPRVWQAESLDLLTSSQRSLARMPPLEMREIEHSLCEYDKYERARLNEGHLKRRYQGS